MYKLSISLLMFSFLQVPAIAFDNLQQPAFSNEELASAPIAIMPKGTIEEAPEYIESSNESAVVLSNITQTPELIGKEYAGTKAWGHVCNILHTPNGVLKWSINRYNLGTDTNETLFGVSNNRKIQSVACDPFGDGLLFSMKDAVQGDFEIYSLYPDEEESLQQLTNNDTDDVDVTADMDGTTIAWQQRLADGRQAIVLTHKSSEDNSLVVKSLASASPFVQPSLSANGKWLVFVQLRPSFFAVMRYDIENNKYKEIRTIARRKRLYHPSISNDGNIIGWSENRSQNRYMVKNISENTITQALNNSNGIEHASVGSTGKVIAYSINTDNKRQTLLTHLETLETTRLGEILYDSNRYLGTSWLGTSLVDVTSEMISGKVFVEPNLPFLISFYSDNTGAEFGGNEGGDGPYSTPFTWNISDSGVSLTYPDRPHINLNFTQFDNDKITAVVHDENNDGGIIELLKPRPIDLEKMDGQVISLDVSGSDICSAITFAFHETSVEEVQVCTDLTEGTRKDTFRAAESNSFDDVLVLESEDNFRNRENIMVLLEGSFDTVGQILSVERTNGEVELVSTANFTAVPAPHIVGEPVFIENGGNSTLTIKFNEDMNENRFSIYAPGSSLTFAWSDAQTLVTTFTSYPAGGTVTYEAGGFLSTDGRIMDEPYTFTFPE